MRERGGEGEGEGKGRGRGGGGKERGEGKGRGGGDGKKEGEERGGEEEEGRREEGRERRGGRGEEGEEGGRSKKTGYWSGYNKTCVLHSIPDWTGVLCIVDPQTLQIACWMATQLAKPCVHSRKNHEAYLDSEAADIAKHVSC